MNKVVIPVILAVTILVAGIFALVPIDKAITVHTTLQSATDATTQTTTITDDTALEVRDQDRYAFWEIDAATTITDFILIPDTDIDIDGNLTATLVDVGATGSSKVDCRTASGADLTISGGLDSINTVGEILNSALPDDCEAIKADVANGDHLIISLQVDITEEG